jgi:hypothetical protein
MMGHANVSTTIDVYGGEFGKLRSRRAGESTSGYGNLMETAPGNRPQPDLSKTAQEAGSAAN